MYLTTYNHNVRKAIGTAWSSLVVGDEGWIGPSKKLMCVYDKSKKIMQHMHGIIPQLFDFWANPVAHLLLLKSSMVRCRIGRLRSCHKIIFERITFLCLTLNNILKLNDSFLQLEPSFEKKCAEYIVSNFN